MSEHNTSLNRHLYRLDELNDFEVAEGDPDVRGWSVIGSDGKAFGTVDDLIVDPKLMRVRYLDILAKEELAWGGGDRHLLIPIGVAQLHEDSDKVVVDGVDVATLRRFPVYTGGPVVRDYEHSLRDTIAPGRSASSQSEEDYYKDSMYDENRFYGARRTRRGMPNPPEDGYFVFRRKG
ncbi:MAG: PRC-barrel domain-containing protein [Hymenobacteraceae bacterium]|nr:PRC-barrel domain-containing protein [Hymenobacteraceae bacterium]MDX5397282.1 PRC-barrel domain-containing protein [Hymenobacteraceae bacterium]MDX5442541.1 PRC-barrel domain-containing protein [Hymenobacteraceae bacterium]MDX5513360.1 PRC-barrel domain-containing protein [Hymenobacteraceae bacterium]